MSATDKNYQAVYQKITDTLRAVDELIQVDGEDRVCSELTKAIGADLFPSEALDSIVTARTNATPATEVKSIPLSALLFRADDRSMDLLVNIIQSAEMLIEEIEGDPSTDTGLDDEADRFRRQIRPLVDMVNSEMFERVHLYKHELDLMKNGG